MFLGSDTQAVPAFRCIRMVENMPRESFKAILTLQVVFILQGYFLRPSENTVRNKHNIDISQAILTLQGCFCLARQKVKHNLESETWEPPQF